LAFLAVGGADGRLAVFDVVSEAPPLQSRGIKDLSVIV
jgi:hypothetical protein